MTTRKPRHQSLRKNSAGGDRDTDGLADGWEKFHFGGLNLASPGAIFTPDGLTLKEKAKRNFRH